MTKEGTVHPHACGEHTGAYRGVLRSAGSSPRLWGTFSCTGVDELTKRFIPTPVGNINQAVTGKIDRAVHPHACGEHFLLQWPGLL